MARLGACLFALSLPTIGLADPVPFERIETFLFTGDRQGVITTADAFAQVVPDQFDSSTVDFERFFIAYQTINGGNGCTFDLDNDVSPTAQTLNFHTTLIQYGSCDMGFAGMAVIALPNAYRDYSITFTQETLSRSSD